MALLDVLKPKVRTLADWSPESSASDVDVAALIADMRRTDVPALDAIIIPVLDAPTSQGWLAERERAGEVVRALSDADKMRLFGRATLIAAALNCRFDRVFSSGDHASWFHNGTAWEKLIEAAIYCTERAVVKLDDPATLDIVRAARCRLSQGSTRQLGKLVELLVAKAADPMSAAQRRALVDLAERIDKATWTPGQYQEALQSIGPLFAKIGRPVAESDVFVKDQQLKTIAEAAREYVCEGTSPPLATVIRGICEDDSHAEFEKRPGVSELQAATPRTKGELLGMIVEAYLRASALRESKAPNFPPYDEIRTHLAIVRRISGRKFAAGRRPSGNKFVKYSGNYPIGLDALVAVLLKKQIIADDRTSAALLAMMPRWDALQDLRVVKIALATIAAGPAPLTRKAAQDLVSATFDGEGRASRGQVLDALGAALEPGVSAANTGQPVELPLAPRPILKDWSNFHAFEKELTAYYGDLDDLRKCAPQELAFIEDYLKGPERPPTPYRVMQATPEERARHHWHTSSRHFPAVVVDRMRKAAQVPAEFHAAWKALHLRAYELEGKSAPSDKWLKAARTALAGLSAEQRIAFLTTVLDILTPAQKFPTDDLARALVYLAADWAPDAIGPILARHAQKTCFENVPGWGMRNERLGNACLWALIHMPDGGGVPYLARLLSRVKYPKVKKRIEAALDEAAAKAGITRGELDELSIPTHDLDARGTAEIGVGEGAAVLAISGTASVEVTWRAANGKVSKSVPAALKAHKDAIKSVKARAKEIEADLSAQPQRLQRFWLDDRRWSAEVWRSRYIQHPLVGALSRRLIWNVHRRDERVAAIWSGDGMLDVGGKPVALDGAEITLWHPIGCAVEEVMAWRARLDALGITQPFKQAHREVYLVTDAERRTGAYSNRFAGHIVKQHQLIALARLNGWTVTHRIWADKPNDEPTHIVLPRHGLAAYFWTAGAGGDDPEVTESQAYLYLTTDQLRFYRIADPAEAVVAPAHGPRRGGIVDIADVPPLALSEVMRQCDLFVGVASVANDPNWVDGGRFAQHPNQWHRTIGADYWRTQAFGDLGAMAETRRALLTALLPSLALGKVARIIDGRFLRVEGKRRAYKIHLGSGNILMEPTDRYLCIVPVSAGAAEVRLPFEGDNMLSIILSKAAMLAADDKITDPSILSQLGW
jgi:hypothetical protein